MKPSFAIIGCGKVGTALARFLSLAGYPAAGVASRSRASAQRTAAMIGCDRFSDVAWQVTSRAEMVLITTPDSAIAATCDRLVQNSGLHPQAAVLHCSGALPSTILESAKTAGAAIGSMHPLQSFASREFAANPFEGIIVAIEGDPPAAGLAQQAARDLGATGVAIRTEAKTLYHAAAVVASNYLVTLLDLALRLIAAAGISESQRFAVLKPLIQGTLDNIAAVGIPAALTGPIVRGDVETVARHVAAIQAQAPALLSLYQALGRHTINVATSKGALSQPLAQQLRHLLAGDPPAQGIKP